MISFELKPQRSGAVAVTRYNEDGEHRGAVAVMEKDLRHGAVIRVPKAVTLDGLEIIVARLRSECGEVIERMGPRPDVAVTVVDPEPETSEA